MSIRKKYAYHKPSAAGVVKIAKLRQLFSDLEDAIESLAPASRERSVAITHLEESAMWAIKAVVMNDAGSEVDPDSTQRPFNSNQDVPDRPKNGFEHSAELAARGEELRRKAAEQPSDPNDFVGGG